MSVDTEWLIVGELPDVINCVRRSSDDVWCRYVPERTCRIKEDADTGCFLTCSECGAIQPDEWTVYYCWSCGAKVVEK